LVFWTKVHNINKNNIKDEIELTIANINAVANTFFLKGRNIPANTIKLINSEIHITGYDVLSSLSFLPSPSFSLDASTCSSLLSAFTSSLLSASTSSPSFGGASVVISGASVSVSGVILSSLWAVTETLLFQDHL